MDINEHSNGIRMHDITRTGDPQSFPSDHEAPLASASGDTDMNPADRGDGQPQATRSPFPSWEPEPGQETLLAAYLASYTRDHLPNSVRMEYGKAFALALLRHNYPETKGYLVKPSSLGPIAKNGISLMLKSENGSDPDYVALKPRPDPKKSKKKLSKAQRERLRIETYSTAFKHGMGYTMRVNWARIESEDIAGFVVLSKHSNHNDYRPITYLALIIDDLTNFLNIAATNDIHRSDLLVDALSRNAKIQRGYGILLYGSRLEIYAFDNKAETIVESEDGVKGTISMEDPVMTLCTTDLGAHVQALEIDLCTTSLGVVNQVFAMYVLPQQITYIDDDGGAGGGDTAEDIGGDSANGTYNSDPE